MMVTLMATPNLIDSILKVIGPAAKMAFCSACQWLPPSRIFRRLFGKASKEHGSLLIVNRFVFPPKKPIKDLENLDAIGFFQHHQHQ
jgi:hypothetical protein